MKVFIFDERLNRITKESSIVSSILNFSVDVLSSIVSQEDLDYGWVITVYQGRLYFYDKGLFRLLRFESVSGKISEALNLDIKDSTEPLYDLWYRDFNKLTGEIIHERKEMCIFPKSKEIMRIQANKFGFYKLCSNELRHAFVREIS